MNTLRFKKALSMLLATMMVLSYIIPAGILTFAAQSLTENYFSDMEDRVLNITYDMKLEENIYNVSSLNISDNNLNLNGFELHVTGDVVISGSGTLELSGGTLIVDGNFKYTSANDTVLNDGKVYLKGNFTHDWCNGSDNFQANTGNTFILCGDEKQTIYFYTTASYFGSLEITNTSSEGVYFSTNTKVIGNAENKQTILSGTTITFSFDEGKALSSPWSVDVQ